MDDTSAASIAAALDEVGPRLRRLRTQRRITLTGAREHHRHLEEHAVATGDRAAATDPGTAPRVVARLRVPLDDLVAAPEVGDPRIRLKPGRVKGRTVIPLTRQPDGIQAWKIVPTGAVNPRPRAHDGSEWIYVLSGHMRLVFGDEDRVLGPGEVAVSDTRVPHWFGSAGDEPAGILSIFGRLGERMNLRTTPPHPDLPARERTVAVPARSRRDRP